MSDDIHDSTEQGRLAAARGETNATNPHPADSKAHASWLRGYESFKIADDEGGENDFA